MEPAALLQLALRVIASFKPGVDTLDTHIARALSRFAPGDADATFVQQVAYGVTRHERPLRIFLSAFYHTRGANAARADYPLYQVLTYLAVFRADELGVARLAVLLDATPPRRATALVAFLLDEAPLRAYVMEDLGAFLDRAFVDEALLGALRRAEEGGLRTWLRSALAREGGGDGSGSSSSGMPATTRKRAPTVPRAPLLTAPRARLPPEPVRISTGFTAAPVPAANDARSLADSAAARAAAAAATREATMARYGAAGPRAPELRASARPSNLAAITAAVTAEREAAGRPEVPFRARPMPELPAGSAADVRFTTAALLREDAVFKKRQEEEARELRAFEAELRDASGFEAWRAETRARDEAVREEAALARHREAAAATAAAAAAHAQKLAVNAAQGVAMRAVTALVDEHVSMEAAAEVASRVALAASVKAVEYVAPAVARARVKSERKAAAAPIREENAAAEAARAAARAAEVAERAEIVRQCLALERVKPHVTTVFDPSIAGVPERDPDAGVWIDAMSLVELRERLAMLRADAAETERVRRGAILASKREAGTRLHAIAAAVGERRAAAASAAATRRATAAAAAAAAAAHQQRLSDDAAIATHTAAAAVRDARAARAAEASAAAARASHAAAFSGVLSSEEEKERLLSVQRAMERRTLAEQDRVLAAAAHMARIDVAEEQAADVRDAMRASAARDAELARNAALTSALADGAAERAHAQLAHKEAFTAAVIRADALTQAKALRDPYAARGALDMRNSLRAPGAGTTVGGLRTLALTSRRERLPPGHPLVDAIDSRLTAQRFE